MDHPFLAGFADGLSREGFATLRFTFPYAQAGRRLPGPAGHALATWQAATSAIGRAVAGVPLIAAGKSYGGRMASMAAAEGLITPDALVYLGYPLHPPGRPDKLRADHLPLIPQPQLFVAGTGDPFIQPRDQFDAVVDRCQAAEVAWVEDAGHSFEVKGARRPADEIGLALAAPVARWIEDTMSL